MTSGTISATIDCTGLLQRLLVDAEVVDGLDHHVVVRIDRGRERLGIEQALLGASDDIEDIFLLVPPHLAGGEDVPLLGGIPQPKPLRKVGNPRIALQEPEREGMERR